MAAPTLVGSPVTSKESTGGVATTDPFNVPLPAGSPTNPELDVIVVEVQFSVGSERDYVIPSGWSLLSRLFANSEWETYLLARIAGASPSLSFVKTRISTGLLSASFGIATAHRFAPAAGQTFTLSDVIGVISASFPTPNDPPAISLGSTTDAAIIAGAGAPASLTVSAYPSGYGVGQATISESGNDRRLSTAVKYVTGVSSEDPGAFTYSGVNSFGKMFTIAIKGTGGPSGPTLSAPTSSDTATTITGGFTTTGTDGTANAVWIPSGTQPTAPTPTQIRAGQDASNSSAGVLSAPSLSISSSGVKNFSAATGGTSGLTYWGFAVHRNAAGTDSNVLALGAAYPGTGRPVSDITPGGFTPSTGSFLADMLNENASVADATKDATYITGPTLSGTPASCIVRLNKSYPAGTINGFKFRKWTSAGTATVRFRFLNDAGAVMGTTPDQVINTTPTTYTQSVTLTGAATRLEIIEQA